jgi:hypothetical protein
VIFKVCVFDVGPVVMMFAVITVSETWTFPVTIPASQRPVTSVWTFAWFTFAAEAKNKGPVKELLTSTFPETQTFGRPLEVPIPAFKRPSRDATETFETFVVLVGTTFGTWRALLTWTFPVTFRAPRPRPTWTATRLVKFEVPTFKKFVKIFGTWKRLLTWTFPEMFRAPPPTPVPPNPPC